MQLTLQDPCAAQGEDQKKLDVVSNEVFCNALRASGRTGIIASEEEDFPVSVEETFSGAAPSLCCRLPGIPAWSAAWWCLCKRAPLTPPICCRA